MTIEAVRKHRLIILGAIAVCAVVAAVCIFMGVKNATAAPPIIWESVLSVAGYQPPEYRFHQNEAPTVVEDDGMPEGKLFITPERKKYKDGDMALVVPKLGVNASVWNGTDETTLKKGACLYEYSQLPGESDRNVSIAAHRNGIKNGKPTEDALFYKIDTMNKGDYFYLKYEGSIYRYVYETTYVVGDEDWAPIYSQGYSCLTLTTCTPVSIHMTEYRLIVRSRLDQVFPESDDFEYLSSAPASN